jgi:hypothetical protein
MSNDVSEQHIASIFRAKVLTAVVMKSTIFKGYNAVSSVECQMTFRRNISLLATCFHAGFLLGLFFDPED